MPEKNQDLHGMVPDASPVALLLIDVVNAMEFDGGETLAAHALPAARRIAELRRKAKALKVPVIYCNDNFGKWQSDFRDTVNHALGDVPGREVTALLRPEGDEYFVLKPKHSAFFATTLELLLKYLGVRTVILCGFSGDVCVLFTANDAYMRDLHIHVPSDCVASLSDAENRRTLAYMRRVLDVVTTPSNALDLERLLARHGEPDRAGEDGSTDETEDGGTEGAASNGAES
jgi:nicotinamidase-related amidase